MPTIIWKKASNWVDRGEQANKTLRRVLAHLFDRFDVEAEPWLDELAVTILGMVAADATEVHLAGYLRSVAREEHVFPHDDFRARDAAVALWHIAKCALVRDFAERVLNGEVPANEPTPDSFSHWIASRLLTADELQRFEEEGRADDKRG
jgi:hypothetical protein